MAHHSSELFLLAQKPSNSRRPQEFPNTNAMVLRKATEILSMGGNFIKKCEAKSEMKRNSRKYPTTQRLFVSAILSLISILISPVLSTDAMWNVITDATGTGLETSLTTVTSFNQWFSPTAGQA